MKYLLFVFSFSAVLLFSCNSRNTGTKQVSADTARKEPVVVQSTTQGPGEQVYTKYCLACHQPDGNGMKGMFPPLAGNVKITGAETDIIKIVLFGLEGPITINGEEQNFSQVMPAQDYLTDQQIADVLTYVRSSWGNKASPVKPEEVAEVRQKGKQ